MKQKKLFYCLILGICLLLIGCSSSFRTVEQIQTSGKLVVTTNAEFAPFEYKEGKELKGIDMDIIKAYAEYLGVELEIHA